MKFVVYFLCLIGFGATTLSAFEAETRNFLGEFTIRENDGKNTWTHSYPVQKDSFSVPPDWNPGDRFDWYYMLANISPDAQRYSTSDRIIRGKTAVYNGKILSLYDFEILLTHPLAFSQAKEEFSRIEEIHYVSRKVNIDDLAKSLKPIRVYFEVSHKKLNLNYENRSKRSLCIDQNKIPEDYFFVSKLNPFWEMTEFDDWGPAPILERKLEVPPIPSCAVAKGKLPKDFWIPHWENLRKLYGDDESFRLIQFGFRDIEDYFSDPETAPRMSPSSLVFYPETLSLKYEGYLNDKFRNDKALKGAVLALKALVEYWQNCGYEDFRVEKFAYWIEQYEAQNETP